jgi:hypothetical protein
MNVFRADFNQHLFEELGAVLVGCFGQFKYRNALWLKDRIVVDVAKLPKKILVENAEITRANVFCMLPLVWNEWVRKNECALLDFNDFSR